MPGDDDFHTTLPHGTKKAEGPHNFMYEDEEDEVVGELQYVL